MKQIIKLFSVFFLITAVNASTNWVPIILGQIITSIPSMSSKINTEPTLTSNKSIYNLGDTVRIQIHNKRNIDEPRRDWIGIYPKNSNNDWDNVVDWKFVNNRSNTQSEEDDWYKFYGLRAGDYEARLFFDNTRHLETSYAFSVDADSADIFIIGDSTVYISKEYNGTNLRGWGDAIQHYIKNPYNVFNRARQGASSKSFKKNDKNHHDWYHTKKLIESRSLVNGGYLFIQFGHNDQAKDTERHTEAGIKDGGYYKELKKFITESRSLGVTPVLITPVNRFSKSHTHGLYPKTMRMLAKDENVLLLDLEQKSFEEFNSSKYSTNEDIKEKFGNDGTHFNPEAASIVASWIKELACQEKNKALCSQFKSIIGHL